MTLYEIVGHVKENRNLKKIILNGEDRETDTLLTDSRNLFNPGSSLFFAIRTPRGNDGHNFLNTLYDLGVRNFVVEYLPDDFKGLPDSNILMVEDTVNMLSAIGSINRDHAKEIVAITGSRGKTTVKEMAFRMMEPFKKISRSPRSYNSRIGVPLSLWQIKPETDLAIIEAGISREGEMKNLASIVNPDVVLFTNIGEAHSEGFKNKERKAEEKSLMAEASNAKVIIYPADDEYISKAIRKYSHGKVMIDWSFQNPSASLYIKEDAQKEGRRTLSLIWKGREFKINVALSHDYDRNNIAAVAALLLYENIPLEEIKQRFNVLSHIDTRLNVSEGINGCSVILDSYTSDLSSLMPAIEFMRRRKIPGQSLTLILSDLAHETDDLHNTYEEVSRIISQSGISKFIGIGETIRKFAPLFPPASLFFKDTTEFLNHFDISDFNDEIILLKGSPQNSFAEIYRQLEAKKHETVLEVNLDAMIRNYNYFRHKVPSSTGVIAMVKAFGYGVGSYEIAKTLQDIGAAYLAVAVMDEGIDLRKNGITMPIMIMNPRSVNYQSLFSNRLEPVVYSMQMLTELISQAKKNKQRNYPVHLKLDTGMHRMGFIESELQEVVSIIRDNNNIHMESIFSHLATADCLDMDPFTIAQLELFERMSSFLISELGYEVKRHILNSAGIIRFPRYHYELVRLGIGLYGANTLPPEIEKPLSVVASLKTVIICIRTVDEGEAVGYSRKGKIQSKSRVATLPIGYADGMDRRFGNGNLYVLVNGQPAPTIGNICMDATMIDVTGLECHEGDQVEIFGNNIPLESLAQNLDTIPYEILTSVSPRVKRVYYRE